MNIFSYARAHCLKPYSVFVGFLALLFFFGGSSRQDQLSNIILYPLTAVIFVFSLSQLTTERMIIHRNLLAFASAITFLMLFHVIPLPPNVTNGLPGRGLMNEAIDLAGIRSWLPITASPIFGRHALISLLVPFTTLLLLTNFSSRDMRSLGPIVIFLAVASAFWGIAQLAMGANSALYTYKVTHFGYAVGALANRNHSALFICVAIPIADYLIFKSRKTIDVFSMYWALLCNFFLISMIVVIGSRTILLISLFISTLSLFFCFLEKTNYLNSEQKTFFVKIVLPISSLIYALVVIAILYISTRTSVVGALARTLKLDINSEDRDEVWSLVFSELWKYWPVGTGSGSYQEVFQSFEPDTFLVPAYSNHAHNDWLEVVLTLGLPGTLLLLCAVVWLFRACSKLLKAAPKNPETHWAWLGCSIVLAYALASLVDYPLRVPILSAFFVVACVWVSNGVKGSDGSRREEADPDMATSVKAIETAN